MKFALVLLIASAITGLGEAHQYPDSGSLHENIHVLENTLEDELADFMALVPLMSWIDKINEYKQDEQVQELLQFLLTPEFHTLLGTVENLGEFKAFVIHMEKMGYNTVTKIQFIHKMIGMDDYVPPEMKIIKSQFGVQKVGDGLKGLIEDLRNQLPLEEIDALYKKKIDNSPVFADFVENLLSAETKEIIDKLRNNDTYKEFDTKVKEKGLEFQEVIKLYFSIYGIQLPIF